jgi:hypothetical protein
MRLVDRGRANVPLQNVPGYPAAMAHLHMSAMILAAGGADRLRAMPGARNGGVHHGRRVGWSTAGRR